jgi:diguanylate cyclase (GGDEF)-like protein
MSTGMERAEPVHEHRFLFRREWFYFLIILPWIRDLADIGRATPDLYEIPVKAILSGLIALGVGVLIRQTRKIEYLNHEVERLAITDSLTGLFNVGHLHEELRKEVERSRRTKRPLSLVFFDVDCLKELNDVHGHQAGSRVLEALGKALPMVIRKNVDSAYRWGGDEFVIMLPEADHEGAYGVAERLRSLVADKKMEEIKEFDVTISLGVSELQPGEDPAAFLQRVDMAMYQAKRGGKNRTNRG